MPYFAVPVCHGASSFLNGSKCVTILSNFFYNVDNVKEEGYDWRNSIVKHAKKLSELNIMQKFA